MPSTSFLPINYHSIFSLIFILDSGNNPHQLLFALGSHPGALTIITGVQDVLTIRSATLPITHRLTPERP